ncbi:MAG: hypothetical protein KKG99_04425 [Bacteroidetes bacterium]|nr:hypothetical protein [Bacteroidota bacterium]
MNYLAASCRGINLEILFIDDASIGVPACAGRLNSFIPIRCAIGIRSSYRFQFTTFLKSEFHE